MVDTIAGGGGVRGDIEISFKSFKSLSSRLKLLELLLLLLLFELLFCRGVAPSSSLEKGEYSSPSDSLPLFSLGLLPRTFSGELFFTFT